MPTVCGEQGAYDTALAQRDAGFHNVYIFSSGPDFSDLIFSSSKKIRHFISKRTRAWSVDSKLARFGYEND
jgi:hypothetical protein